MKIYLMGEQAFVPWDSQFMICIGSKTEVDEATPDELQKMIKEAIAWSIYRSIEKTIGKPH